MMTKLRPVRGKLLPSVRMYHIGELDTKRSGKVWWASETKAFDMARAGVICLSPNMTDDEADDDNIIEAVADENEWLFDSEGHLYERVW